MIDYLSKTHRHTQFSLIIVFPNMICPSTHPTPFFHFLISTATLDQQPGYTLYLVIFSEGYWSLALGWFVSLDTCVGFSSPISTG